MSEAPGAAAFEAALGALLPPGVGVSVWSEAMGVGPLGPREAEAVARAVPKRRVEFARGRACAREALRRAGYGAGPSKVESTIEIPVGSSREPIWPTGFTGSITHCEGLVAAAAAPVSVIRGVGLDAEVDQALPTDIVDQVLTAEERDRHDAIVRFSVKESIHKTVFPLTGVWLDFLDVAVTVDGRAFRARPTVGAKARVPELESLEGRYVRVGGVVVAVSWI